MHYVKTKVKIPKSITINGYKSEMTQVLITVLSNAAEVLQQRSMEKKMVTIVALEKEDSVFLAISDNGGGIADSAIERIFDPYFTTKQQRGGTGLGLYIAKIIIEHNLKGTICAHNRGDGARFLITLPRA